jgi:hypothetical protein
VKLIVRCLAADPGRFGWFGLWAAGNFRGSIVGAFQVILAPFSEKVGVGIRHLNNKITIKVELNPRFSRHDGGVRY